MIVHFFTYFTAGHIYLDSFQEFKKIGVHASKFIHGFPIHCYSNLKSELFKPEK